MSPFSMRGEHLKLPAPPPPSSSRAPRHQLGEEAIWAVGTRPGWCVAFIEATCRLEKAISTFLRVTTFGESPCAHLRGLCHCHPLGQCAVAACAPQRRLVETACPHARSAPLAARARGCHGRRTAPEPARLGVRWGPLGSIAIPVYGSRAFPQKIEEGACMAPTLISDENR